MTAPTALTAWLDELTELRAKATSGAWAYNTEQPETWMQHEGRVWAPDVPDGFDDEVALVVDHADAALIVAAVNALTALVDTIRAVAELAETWARRARNYADAGDVAAARDIGARATALRTALTAVAGS